MADAHAKPNHDYHIIDPSPWPFIGSVGALVMALGGVAWMQYLNAGSFPIFARTSPNPSFTFTPNFSTVAPCRAKTSSKKTRTACPNMIGSDTFIIVAFR